MNELVCNYTLIRFLPYRETGEFVNIGVVLYAPEVRRFAFRIANKTNRRVKNFFPEMNQDVYRTSVDALSHELRRQTGVFAMIDEVSMGLGAFSTMLRWRETLLHFAEPGMKLGDPCEVLDTLYAEYVERRFALAPEYQESVMRNRLSGWLKDWGLRKRYRTNLKVGDAMFHLSLPFVHMDHGEVTAAIKPLDLNREEPTDVYDHGGLWIQRFERLKERRKLPERMIVPVLLPTGVQNTAAIDVIEELTQAGVQVVPFDDTE